jgi:integrase
MNKAGYRMSEPFHLFIEDVIHDPTNTRSAIVLIHHPQEGTVPSSQGSGSIKRIDYLRNRWNFLPRNLIRGKLHAGWKGGIVEKDYGSKFIRANWFTPDYGEVFMDLWKRYLEQALNTNRAHPFAFVNIHSHPGAPYTISQFERAHGAAIERIGLHVSKAEGTTVHGHRHDYAQQLKDAGIESEYIRICLHHSSIESQGAYTRPTPAQVRDALKLASRQMNNRGGASTS